MDLGQKIDCAKNKLFLFWCFLRAFSTQNLEVVSTLGWVLGDLSSIPTWERSFVAWRSFHRATLRCRKLGTRGSHLYTQIN